MTALAGEWVEEVAEARAPRGWGGLFYGAYPALVRDVRDPDRLGRVKVSLPWSPDGGGAAYEAWARVATLLGGSDRGTWFIPDPNDEVLVVFVGGDPRHPVVVGGMWNGRDAPPARMDDAGENRLKRLKTRNGLQLTMHDDDGREAVELETPGGQKLTLKDGPGTIELQDSSGNRVTLESSGITVNAAGKVTVSAGGTVEVSAGVLNVNAGMSKFSGVVKADTVITNSVVSTSYTPGAGNIW